MSMLGPLVILTAVAVAFLLIGVLSDEPSLPQIGRPSLAKFLRDGPGDAASLPGGGRVIENLQVGGVHFAIVETPSGPYYWLYVLNPQRGWRRKEIFQPEFQDPEEDWVGFMGRAPFAKSRDFLVEKVIPSVLNPNPNSKYHGPLYAPHEIDSLYS